MISEYDIGSIHDPFLQVNLLMMMRLILTRTRNLEKIDELVYFLAELSNNTDNTKNSGNSILYQTLLTIIVIKENKVLTDFVSTLIEKFLQNKDRNIKYIGLKVLAEYHRENPVMLNEYQYLLVECFSVS